MLMENRNARQSGHAKRDRILRELKLIIFDFDGTLVGRSR
jgi:hypothetical protein